ncbi:MAG: hypothetical protein QOJ13_1947 [Gaiellales bacterium]|jgi:hypothetical protein|nr:hypothetical protein [Gaiellales bacterium]
MNNWVELTDDEVIDVVVRLESEGWYEDESFPARTCHRSRMWVGPGPGEAPGFLHVHYSGCCSPGTWVDFYEPTPSAKADRGAQGGSGV